MPLVFWRALTTKSITAYRTIIEDEPVSGEALMRRSIEVQLEDEPSSKLLEVTER